MSSCWTSKIHFEKPDNFEYLANHIFNNSRVDVVVKGDMRVKKSLFWGALVLGFPVSFSKKVAMQGFSGFKDRVLLESFNVTSRGEPA